METLATFYAAATPRTGTEDVFEKCIRQLADRETVDGVRFSILEVTPVSAALRGEMPLAECPECPEALATYLEDQLVSREGIYLNLDVNIA
ncbi:hypothetical protein [Arthrobacter mobilis]|uniref:Uncharacterized protein n=1 Tax=Arthrobacter mobilis TaxID=2724944 RepID=A0A7X6HC78_9MICC|nr:hypothetical protein [Arthrobacter mobilis]NKX54446.1 hypothetical protein [Arthrobacter mobilis]